MPLIDDRTIHALCRSVWGLSADPQQIGRRLPGEEWTVETMIKSCVDESVGPAGLRNDFKHEMEFHRVGL